MTVAQSFLQAIPEHFHKSLHEYCRCRRPQQQHHHLEHREANLTKKTTSLVCVCGYTRKILYDSHSQWNHISTIMDAFSELSIARYFLNYNEH